MLGIVFGVQASEISEQNIIELVNQSRERAGLKELLENQKLDQIANLKAQDMLDNKYFAHTSPSGITPWDWFSKVGYSYSYAGENLAIDFSSAEDQHQAWMESATHRKNILSDKFSEIGVAVAAGEVRAGGSSLIVVQVFGSPSAWQKISEKENFFLGRDKLNALEEERRGMVLSSQESNDLSQQIFAGENKFLGFQDTQKTIWFLLIILSFGILLVNPIHWVGKSFLESLKLFQAKLSQKIIVKNENDSEIKIIKIKTCHE